jgi:2,4-dienoyl-CoA reductase-like NADH-dependent reductase (Old Yellow Enzyme family)
MYDSNRTGQADTHASFAPLLERFERGEFDLVGVGRSLLNDARWVERVQRGEPLLPYDDESRKKLT